MVLNDDNSADANDTADKPPQATQGSVEASVLDVLEELFAELRPGAVKRAELHADSTLEGALALDSLARVELNARLGQRLGFEVDEQVLFDAATPRALLAGLRGTATQVVAANTGARERATTSAHASRAAPSNVATLIDLLEWHATHHPDHEHIRLYDDVTDGVTLTCQQLWQRATICAAHLQARDLLPGERVALMLPTSEAYFVCFFGVLLAGGVPVPIYPPARKAQLEDHLRRQSTILQNSGVVQLITVTEAVPVARLLGGAVATLRHVLDAAELESPGPAFELARRRDADLAFLQYTSGSTGDPKGVMLSHANVIANIRADGHGMHAQPGDTFVSWLPLYHDMGLIGAWLGSLYHGVHLVVMSPLAFLSRPARWLQAISRYQGNLSAAPNFAYELCIKRIADKDLEGVRLDSWRIAANGAEAISAATMDAFCERFAPYGFARTSMFPVYGLAECSVGLTFPPPGRGPVVDMISRSRLSQQGLAEPIAPEAGADELLLVGCGSPLPGHQLRIVDGSNTEVPERREGRIQFCGPSATAGYFARPEATSALFCDDWLETGDRGYLASGELFITGRTKDIIIRAGRNVYPAEFEDAIGNLDGVRKGHVAVFGSSDASTGTERVVVLAETRKRGDSQHAQLRDAILELGDALLGLPPDEVVLVQPNTVLRTSSGKVRRDACRQLYERNELDGKPPPAWLQLGRLFISSLAPRSVRAANRLGAQIHALFAWLAFVVCTVPAYISAWLPLPLTARWQLARFWARCAAVLALPKIAVEGAAHLPARDQGAVLVINHQSYLDGPLAFALLPAFARFVVKADLGSSWLLGVPLRRLGILFIERFNAVGGLDGLQAVAAELAQGDLVVMFPEGTFRRMPGLLPFRMGPFTLAARQHVPVIPVVLRGTRNVLRDGTWAPRRGKVSLHIGPPIMPQANLGEWQRALALRDSARAFMLRESGEPDLAHESIELPAKDD